MRLGAACLLALAPSAAAQTDDIEVRSFALPDTRAARGLVAAIEGHIAAERMEEAAAQLQELLEEHSGALLPGRRSDAKGQRSQQPVHAGVAPWATAQLFALPAGPQESYRRRHEDEAAAQLERAILATDREALAGVGTRWPLTHSAERAWWILGDLTLERGLLAETRHAWRRGAAWALHEFDLRLETPEDWRSVAARFAERDDAEAIEARLALAASSLEVTPDFDAALHNPPHGELRLPGEAERHPSPLSGEASAWGEPFSLPQNHPFRGSYNNFYAGRSGNRIVVSNSMRAVCVDAFSGQLLWQTNEAPGWEKLKDDERDEFHKTGVIDHSGSLIAPALSDSIAVCALEIPFTTIGNHDFKHIPILRVIPDRRLFAYDLATGALLWSHMPPPNWDGESGTFPETARCAGPPVISGGRVLVPAYRLEGRIAFHVACYELETGALIWNTHVISGQRELNMFNRHQREFSAPPLRVEGDRVLALTQLGSVACLDLFGGELLWETLYDQVSILRRGRFTTSRRESTWSNTPPVVGDGVVVCTPLDSHDLIGLDLETGSMLWSLALRDIESTTGTPKTRLAHLAGCDETTVYLSGQGVIALESPIGLASGAPTRIRWLAEDESMKGASHLPRAILMADRIVWPTDTARVDLDRHQGFRLASPARWSGGRPGNLLVCADAFFTLDNYELNGYFEWKSLLNGARAALAAAPDRPDRGLVLAGLLRESARTELNSQRAGVARALLDEAEALLLEQSERLGESRQLTAHLHSVLTTRAATLEALADIPGALAAWSTATDLAPDQRTLLADLFEEQRLLASYDPERRLAALAEIQSKCAGLTILCEEVEGSVSQLSPVSNPDPEDDSIWELDAALWAAWARIDQHAARGELRLEFASIYELFGQNRGGHLPGGTPRTVALRRLDELLSQSGARALLAPYEERATSLLAEVATLSPESIQVLLDRYPRTRASERGADRLLEDAILAGDVPTAARLVLELLPAPFSLGTGDPLHSSRIIALGLCLRETGNEAYLRGVLRRVAASRTSDSPFLAHAFSHDLTELAEELLAKPPSDAVVESSFSPRARPQSGLGTSSGVDAAILGELPPGPHSPATPERILLVGTREIDSATGDAEITAYGAYDLQQPLWKRRLESRVVSISWRESMRLFGPGYALLASAQEMECINRADGSTRWRWRPAEGEIYTLDSAEGMVLLTTRLSARTFQVLAIDEVGGEPLWSFEYDSRSYHRTAVCGGAWIVLLPTGRLREAVVLDAFSGRVAYSLDLGEPLSSRIAQGTWIQDDKLVIPHFTARRHAEDAELGIVDLARGGPLWPVSVALPDGGESYLELVLRHADRTWLLVRPRGGDDSREASVFELHIGVGAAARIHGLDLTRSEILLGAESGRTHVLDAAEVFVRSEEQGGSVHRLRAHDLSTGARRWAWTLGSNRDLYNRRWPKPAVGANAIAFVFTEKGPRMRTNLLFLDPQTGAQAGSLLLEAPLGWCDQIELAPLGDGLLVAGVQMFQVIR